MTIIDDRRALDGLRNLDPQAIRVVYDQYFSGVCSFIEHAGSCFRLTDLRMTLDCKS